MKIQGFLHTEKISRVVVGLTVESKFLEERYSLFSFAKVCKLKMCRFFYLFKIGDFLCDKFAPFIN